MAGIGFELRRMWGKKNYISNIKAYFVSALVTTGPTIICILMITSMQVLLGYLGESFMNKELFIATIIYDFAFSLIITGGFTLFASRYVSDCIYEKEYNKIIPSFFGMVLIILTIAFLVGNIFFAKSDIQPSIKLISYTIFSELSIIWIQMVYLSTVKDLPGF